MPDTRPLTSQQLALLERYIKLSQVTDDLTRRQTTLRSKVHLIDDILNSLAGSETTPLLITGALLVSKGQFVKRLAGLPLVVQRFHALKERTRAALRNLMEASND